MGTSLRLLKRRAEEIRFRLSENPTLSGRYQLPSLLNARGLGGAGVEVGVFEGWHSDYLLTHWRGQRLISVDPWRAWGDEYMDDLNRLHSLRLQLTGESLSPSWFLFKP